MTNNQTQVLYESFIKKALEAIIFCDSEGQIKMWNQGCIHLFGYSEEKMLEQSIFSLVDHKEFDNFTNFFDILKKDRTFTFETKFVSESGKTVEIEATCGPLKVELEILPIYYFTFRDLSLKRCLETNISKLSMYPETNPDFVLEWDRYKGITYKNKAVNDYITQRGLNRESLNKLLPADFENYMRRLVGTDNKLYDVEANLNENIFSYTFTPFKADGDKVLIIGKDVTAKKALEEEMDFAYDRTKQILDFIESVLKELRFIDLEEVIDIKSVTSQALRDITDQVSMYPTHIFIALENDERLLEGYIVTKHHGQQRLISDKITIHPREIHNLIQERDQGSFANWYDNCSDIEQFQNIFPEKLRKHIPEIRNYASHRIAGEKQGVLIAVNYPKDVNLYDSETIKGLSVAVGTLLSIQSQFRDKEQAQFTVFTKMAELAERRDQETGEHLKRMRNYARIIAQELAKKEEYKDLITPDYIRRLYNAAPLHDIGKVGIPDSILQKPGKLDDKEYEIMQKHTIIGGQVLEGPKFLDMAKDIAYYHHEKYDGSGYPFGLTGNNIPLCARIVAIADVYDAMTSKRVYKEAFSHDRTKKLISICSGGHFVPEVVEAFLAREKDFLRIKEMYKD